MRFPGFIISVLFISFYSSSMLSAQCNIYIQMVQSKVESCVLPVVVSSGEYLFPCSAPAEFNQLVEGDFAYIDYIDSPGCSNFCQFGHYVEITCLSLPVGVDDQEADHGIKVFPTITESEIYIEGNAILQIELYNDHGVQLMKLMKPNVESIDVSNLERGMYFIQVVTKNQTLVKKTIKL